jgi:hypothetical protein
MTEILSKNQTLRSYSNPTNPKGAKEIKQQAGLIRRLIGLITMNK